MNVSSDIVTLHGVQFPSDPSVLTPNILSAIRENRFETEETTHLPILLQSDDVVLDIGAGTGFTALIAERCGVVHVHAVEANPHLVGYMGRLLAANGAQRTTAHNVVLGNNLPSRMEFYQRTDFWMGSLAAGPEPYVSSVMVPTTSFDGFLRTYGVNVILCDIEGGEVWLFEHADLSDVRLIQIEVHDHITGLKPVSRLISTLAHAGLHYDPRFSRDNTLVFHRVGAADVRRPYGILSGVRHV